MEVFIILMVLQALVLCQAKLSIYQASTCSWNVSTGENLSLAVFTEQSLSPLATQICQALGCGEVLKLNKNPAHGNTSCFTGCSYSKGSLINCTKVHTANCSVLSEVVCDTPYSITPTSKSCVFNIKPPATISTVILSPDFMHRVSDEICQNLNCGKAFSQSSSEAPPNSACLTDCIYHNSSLRNCSTVYGNGCSKMSEIICGNHNVRLSGGSHKCAGRVELWKDGQWGTVCDDEWDTQDADVVCAQLNCGYALSINGQDGPYTNGKGPIIMDELNCTGKERSLWECPAVRADHDCGHKEDAGVVCSEYKDLRLTGGLDHCSGRVEIHRNGSWGTVCEECWDKEEAIMACNMLGCGEPKQYTAFEKPFIHKNNTRWYYNCKKDAKILWDCKELDASLKIHLCPFIKAAGLICSNSLGLPEPTTENIATTMETTMQTMIEEQPVFWSLELLGCIILSCLLLIAILSNIIMCCCSRKKRKAFKVQQQYPHLHNNAEMEQNNYRESTHLVKVSNNDNHSAPAMPPQLWTQSSVESTSYDTDYEANDIGLNRDTALSTFRNSTRYNADGRGPVMKGPKLQFVTEEDTGVAMQGHLQVPMAACQRNSASPSADSFETSSTSSEEYYENTGHKTADLYSENHLGDDLQPGIPSEYNTQELLNPTVSGDMDPNGGEDSPIYSPVSAEIEPFLHDTDDGGETDDYDDIGNCLEMPLH